MLLIRTFINFEIRRKIVGIHVDMSQLIVIILILIFYSDQNKRRQKFGSNYRFLANLLSRKGMKPMKNSSFSLLELFNYLKQQVSVCLLDTFMESAISICSTWNSCQSELSSSPFEADRSHGKLIWSQFNERILIAIQVSLPVKRSQKGEN